MTGYYDYVLGLIPAVLIGITAMLTLVGLPLTSAVPVGAGAALVLMGHAMFVQNPVDRATELPTRSEPPAHASHGGASPRQAD